MKFHQYLGAVKDKIKINIQKKLSNEEQVCIKANELNEQDEADKGQDE